MDEVSRFSRRSRRTASILPPGIYNFPESESSDDNLVFDDDDILQDLDSEDDVEIVEQSVSEIDLEDQESTNPPPVFNSMASSSSVLASTSQISTTTSRRRSAALASGSNVDDHPDESPAKRLCEGDEAGPSTRIPTYDLNASCTAEEEDCLFCADAFNSATNHRLIALKCGHCFGQSCAEKWIRQQPKCPTCQKKAKVKDFLPLYISRPNIIDTSTTDKLKQEVENERKEKLEIQRKCLLAQSKINELESENDKLKKDLMRMENMLSSRKQSTLPLANRSNSSTSMRDTSHTRKQFASSIRTYVDFKPLKGVEVDREEKCRNLASSKHLETIAVSMQSSSPVFKGYGIKVVRTHDMKPSIYNHLHSDVIKDMVFKPDDVLLLTASHDGTMKLTSMSDMSTAATIRPGMACSSCCWHPTRRESCFVGLKNGTIQEYDIRRTTGYLREFSVSDAKHVPFVGLQCVHPAFSPNRESSSSGFLCNTLKKAYYITVDAAGNQTSVDPVGIEGSLLPLHYDHESGIGVITQRPSSKEGHVVPNMTHNVLSFTGNYAGTVPFKPIGVFHGGSISDNMTRPRVFCNPDSFNSSGIVMVGDEGARGLLCYDCESNKVEQKIPTQTDVMDVEVVLSMATNMRVAALTKRGITFYERAIQTR
jgi:E3 ubiquitin-protein ligase RFWD3